MFAAYVYHFAKDGVKFKISSEAPVTGALKFSLYAMHGELESFIADYPSMAAAKKASNDRAADLLAKFVARSAEAG